MEILILLTRNALQIPISEPYILNNFFSTEKCLARSMHVFGYSHGSNFMKCVSSFYFWGREMSVTMFSWHKMDINGGVNSLPFFVFKYSYQTAWKNKEHQDLSPYTLSPLIRLYPHSCFCLPSESSIHETLFSSPYLDSKEYVQAWNGVFWLFY